ncbi:cytochrome b5-like heme/steroid binding domain-containing protein [Alistipes putredinis]
MSVEEISAHRAPNDVWIVVGGKVWDVSQFIEEHPGGPASE